jgi:two-component system KDP operon response regulator KdpE
MQIAPPFFIGLNKMAKIVPAKGDNFTVIIVTTDKDALEGIKQAFSLCMPGTLVVNLSKTDELFPLPIPYTPRVIVLDLDVLKGNSLDLIQRLRATNNDFLITISEASDRDLMIESWANGSYTHITKPIHELEFIAKIRALLRHSKY